MVKVYTVIEQEAKPSVVNQGNGQLWAKINSENNLVMIYIFCGDDFYPLISGGQ